MRILAAALLAVGPLAAQFYNLATDDTGDRAWFSSALRLRGTQQSLNFKIFMADASGNIQLVADGSPVDGDPTYSILTNPEVSGDGSVLAYAANSNCPPVARCYQQDYTYGAVSTANGLLTLPGTFHLSRNGRYLVREGYYYFGPTGQIEIIDLATGQRRNVPVENLVMINGGRQVTSSGTVVAAGTVSANDEEELWLFGFDGSVQATNAYYSPYATSPSPAAGAAINDAGDVVVFQSPNDQNPGRCAILQTPVFITYVVTTLVTSSLPCAMQALSADGTKVLFISSANFDGSNSAGLPECWVVDVASKLVESVGHDAAGIAEATLSGDGNVVWAVTLAGRLIRMGRSTGLVQVIIPMTTAGDQAQAPFLYPLGAAAGSLAHLTGRGLAGVQSASSSTPLVTSLGGVLLLADGQPLPLMSVSPTDIVFQVPWDMSGNHTLTLPGTQSAFEDILSRSLYVAPVAPTFWYTPNGLPAISHQDFHGVVSASDPAHPDEILHLFLIGLGPVRPAVETGEAAPVERPSVLTNPVSVNWSEESPIINFPGGKALFAGLAPGLVGIYQIDVQVPHEVPVELGVSVAIFAEGTSYAVPGVYFPVTLPFP